MAKNVFFDFLNNLFYKNKDLNFDDHRKEVNAYMLSLWLSQDQTLIKIVDKINPYIFMLDDKAVYTYYYYSIPKGKRFLQWTKKEKESDKVKKKKKEIKRLYGLSDRELWYYRNHIE